MSLQIDNQSTVPSSGTTNHNDGKAVLEMMIAPPAVRDEMGWIQKMQIAIFFVVGVLLGLAVMGVARDCPLLLLRVNLQIAICGVMFVDALFIVRCFQIMAKRNMPQVLAEVAKLPQQDTPQVREFRLAKANSCSWCGITHPVLKTIWIRYQDETIQLPRSPLSDEEAAGMYAVLVNDDHHVIVGDLMEVVLLENDPSKALYLPFQEECLKDHVVSIARSALFLSVALYALSWTGPVLYASQSQLEAALSWPSCSISRSTTIEYYALILVPGIVCGAFIAFRHWRVAKIIKERSEQREIEQSLLGEATDAENARQII
jgi:hypothetical protein